MKKHNFNFVYEILYFLPKDLYFQFDIVFNGIKNLLTMKKRVLIVQLEKLHDNRRKVVMDFCRIFNLKYERCLMNPTYFGFKWWGDKTSNKLINDSKKKKDSEKLKFHLARTRIAPIGRGGGKAEMAAPKQKGVCGRPAQRSTALSLAVALPTTCAPRH